MLRSTGSRSSVVVAPGLESAGSVVAAHGLSCPMARGIFPDQVQPESPALAGWFFTIELPGKSSMS